MEIQKEINRRFALQEEYGGLHKPVNQIQPLVSVLVSTYQHTKFIEECLRGILDQKTNFPFEIIIGEDHSTDGTREHCITYAQKYPDKIRLFLRDQALSHLYNKEGKLIALLNSVSGFSRMSARGKYIAFCEGDDYWTNAFKLQKQVDYMERNKDCQMCYHAITNLYLSKQQKSEFNGTRTESNLKFSPPQFIKNNYAQTVSQFIRASALQDYPDWGYQSPISSYPLQMICALQGNIGYIGGPAMAVYRIGLQGSTNEGRFGNREEKRKWILRQLENYNNSRNLFNTYSNGAYQTLIQQQKKTFNFQLLLYAQNYFKRKEIIKLYRRYINKGIQWDAESRKFWIELFFKKKRYHQPFNF